MKKAMLWGMICLMLIQSACGAGGGKEPEQELSLTVWDSQIGGPAEAAAFAEKAEALGFTGVEVVFRWQSIEREAGVYDFEYVDAVLDEIADRGLSLGASLMFWSIGLPWAGDLEWQRGPGGEIYVFEGRGAAPSFCDGATVEKMNDAYRAFTAHLHGRFGTLLSRMHARTSQYGELEYFPGDEMLDFGAPAIEKFREYLKARYPGAEELGAACGYKMFFESAGELDEIDGPELAELFYFDWQMFRQERLLDLASGFRDIQRETAPGIPFALQTGSFWDAAAASLRGVFDPYLASKAVDIIHTDDGPGYPHDFSNDYSGVAGAALASEIDGFWHPVIQELLQQGDKSLSPYQTQARRAGAKGLKYLNTANWELADLDKFAPALSEYSALFLEAGKRTPADERQVILINTCDFVLRGAPATQTLLETFNRLSDNGQRQVRFVTDTQLTENPELFDEIGEIYIGATFGRLHLSRAFAAALSAAGAELIAEDGAAEILNEHGAALGDSAPTVKTLPNAD